MKRIDNLDYLRGICALGIMVYHYLSWTLGYFNASTILGRFGIYGVSIFFVLSGITLYYVYSNKTENFKNFIVDFVIKRLFRIIPLLALVISVDVFFLGQKTTVPNFLANVSGLTGFFNQDYLATGEWSIADEMIFYLLFIMIMFLFRVNKVMAYILVGVSFLIYNYYAFYLLRPSVGADPHWWDIYTLPLNQLFLFFSGVAIANIFLKKKVENYISIIALFAGALIFLFFPAKGESFVLVSGFRRIIFTAASLLICFGVLKTMYNLPRLIRKVLGILGSSSYSLYMIHPVVYEGVNLIFKSTGIRIPHTQTIILILSATITLTGSYLLFKFFETPFNRMGRKLSETGIRALFAA